MKTTDNRQDNLCIFNVDSARIDANNTRDFTNAITRLIENNDAPRHGLFVMFLI